MKRLIIAISLALVTLIAGPMQVFAAMANPDSDPTLESVNVYRNLLETGDYLYLIYANIPYATTPDDPVTSTFVWRLMDGAAELGSTTGYAYNENGYGYNVSSMYFTAAEAVALGMVWATPYTLRLSGSPAYFAPPPIYDFTVNAADYSALTVTVDVQAELAARVLTIAAELDNRWALTLSLIEQSDTATVLSLFGEAFFRGAINGLQALAPTLFGVSVRVIDLDDRTWTDNYSANLSGQWDGTWVETAQEAGKALFGTTYDFLSLVIFLIMGGGLILGNIMITSDHWNGLMDVSVLAIAGARLAMFDFVFLILLAAICWIYISAKVWFRLFR